MATFKVSEIIDESTDTIQHTQEIINSATTDSNFDIVDGYWSSIYNFIGVSAAKITNTDCKIKLTKLDNVTEFIENNNDYFKGRTVIVDLGTQLGIVSCNAFKKDNFGHDGKVKLNYKDLLLNKSIFRPIVSQKVHKGYNFRRRSYEEQVTIPVKDLDHIKDWYKGDIVFTDTETNQLIELPIRR